MDLINKIGQRKLAKLLFVLAILLCAIEFAMKKSFHDLLSVKFLLAAILFSGSSGILSIAAHKTREYRLISIVLSGTMIFVNAILFYLNVLEFLLAITVVELIFSTVFAFFVAASYKKQKLHEQKTKSRRKAKAIMTQSKDEITHDAQ